ncbi:L-lactate dehydrogenase [[Clostridium] sordellii]|uniref:L-lactate dehydrogenase n=1 Tax=Paraclostridium sordellii TaxID=1505 RepID=UPI0005EA18BB|nr:L-lactate dehydrogenase [Paeniclostridium sordellii]CEP95811.1 L-lactate dehydrogenase [[Clostridium] sordellii] [Paeniclostridium sordellii]
MKNKVVIIGTGMVGMSYAYSMVNQGTCEELVLIDKDKDRAIGEAMDLNHGLNFGNRKMKIYAGDYSNCDDASIICITAGAIQNEGETRLDLLNKNTLIMKDIISQINKTKFNGILLIATNPVDIMTYVAFKLSGYKSNRVIGSGTTLDSSRLRYILSEILDVNSKNVHAYVMGEHGDSQFVAWSYAMQGVQPIYQIVSRNNQNITFKDLDLIEKEVKNLAYEIIKRKKSTYYGIGMGLTAITKAIIENENTILTVSSYLNGEYGQQEVYISVPSIVNKNGVRNIIELPLELKEKQKLDKSIDIMKENIKKLNLK